MFSTEKTRKLVEYIDQFLYDFLKNNAEIMPKRLCKLIAYNYTDARIRKIYWRRLGVEMGNGTFANIGMIVANNGEANITIGDHVSIAPNVTFVSIATANNGVEINALPYVKNKLTQYSFIKVEDEVWIGANVTILPGVTIGRCSVIGAGSVVINDVEPYSVYVGTPARKIRDLKTGLRTDTIDQ